MRLGRRFFRGCQVHVSALGAVGATLLAGAAVTACPLRNPVPVEPDYPPSTPFAADGVTVTFTAPDGSVTTIEASALNYREKR